MPSCPLNSFSQIVVLYSYMSNLSCILLKTVKHITYFETENTRYAYTFCCDMLYEYIFKFDEDIVFHAIRLSANCGWTDCIDLTYIFLKNNMSKWYFFVIVNNCCVTHQLIKECATVTGLYDFVFLVFILECFIFADTYYVLFKKYLYQFLL